MAIVGKKSLAGEIHITDTENPANNKKFWGKDAQKKASEYYKKLQSQQKQEVFDVKTGTYKKILPKDIPAFESRKPNASKMEREMNVVMTGFTRLQDKFTDSTNNMTEWTDQDQRDYDYYKKRLDEIRGQMGISAPVDSSGTSSFNIPGAGTQKTGLTYRQKQDRAVWIKSRTNEILTQGGILHVDAKKQATEAWEKEFSDPSSMTDEELRKAGGK